VAQIGDSPPITLACLNALAGGRQSAAMCWAPTLKSVWHTYDETNRRVRPDQIIRMIRRDGGPPR